MPAIHRERVLRAATSSFLARGYGSSVDDIARRAGVAKQTVYQHFASKDELFKAVAGDLAKRVLVELEGAGRARRACCASALEYRKRALGAQGIATFRTAGARGAALPRARARHVRQHRRRDGAPARRVPAAASSTRRTPSSPPRCCSPCSPATTA